MKKKDESSNKELKKTYNAIVKRNYGSRQKFLASMKAWEAVLKNTR